MERKHLEHLLARLNKVSHELTEVESQIEDLSYLQQGYQNWIESDSFHMELPEEDTQGHDTRVNEFASLDLETIHEAEDVISDLLKAVELVLKLPEVPAEYVDG